MSDQNAEHNLQGAKQASGTNAPPTSGDVPEITQRRDDQAFLTEIDALIRASEESRLHFMKQYRDRNMSATTASILIILIAGGGFAWFFLVSANLFLSLLCMLAAILPTVALHGWSRVPLQNYVKNYKADFMPKLARALGGLSFHPRRGISQKILKRTGIMPPHDRYTAEDCFMGRYKDVKIMMSEARLYHSKAGKKPTFDGILVLLETQETLFPGHTIISADQHLVKRSAGRRWQKLQAVQIDGKERAAGRFQVFSDQQDHAKSIVTPQLLKELEEAARIFDNAPLSAAFFKDHYILIALPYEPDMFEPSNIYVPITTKQHVMNCKREMDQIFELVDIFEIYKTQQA